MGRKKRNSNSHTVPSARPVKVGEQVRSALSDALREGALKDPRIDAASLVTVTEVKMTPDLKTARVFVSVYAEQDETKEEVIEGLNSAGAAAQREIADRLGLRFTPKVEFRRDDSIEYGAKIEALLQEIRREDEGES